LWKQNVKDKQQQM